MKKNLAINGGPKTIDKNFPWPIFDETEINAVADVVRSGKWGNPDCGDLVKDFEDEFAAFCGTKYALTLCKWISSTASCTDSLWSKTW